MKMLFVSVVIVAIVAGTAVNGANVARAHQQHASDYDENTCPRRCSEAYYPLCGINQVGDIKVFVNDCYMSMENCNQLTQQVYHATDESDCADFEEWISDDTIRKKLHI